MRGVFRPDELGRLARRQSGRNRCEIEGEFKNHSVSRLGCSFNTSSKTEVTIHSCPTKWTSEPAVFLPTRELLTIYPGFVSLYETTELPFEETWRDTCILLGAGLAKGPRLHDIKALLEPLEDQLGGKVVLDQDKFFVKTKSGNLEVHLVAEGMRKLAMIARLVANGSLNERGSLFWDEPEANLNPRVIRQVARTILQLCDRGIQVFVATHSLFLMRELDVLLRQKESHELFENVEAKFFGLHPTEKNGVRVQQGESIDDIGEIASLEEELGQSDRYLEAENS